MRKLNNYKIIDNKVEIGLTQGQVAIIDESDMDLVKDHRWYAHRKRSGIFYAVTNVKNTDDRWTNLALHKLLMQTPEGFDTDHIDNDGLNNCRSNLRVVTRSQNLMNMRSHRNSSSKFKGVSWDKSRNKWLVMITVDNKRKNLGRFTSEQEAAIAYNLAAKEHYGAFAYLNKDIKS